MNAMERVNILISCVFLVAFPEKYSFAKTCESYLYPEKELVPIHVAEIEPSSYWGYPGGGPWFYADGYEYMSNVISDVEQAFDYRFRWRKTGPMTRYDRTLWFYVAPGSLSKRMVGAKADPVREGYSRRSDEANVPVDAYCAEGKLRYGELLCLVEYQCEFDMAKNQGKPDDCWDGWVGNPINPSTGNKFYKKKDYSTWSASKLEFVRYYNSSPHVFSGGLGTKWRHSYDRSIVVHGGSSATAFLFRPDGKVLQFHESGDAWQPDADVSMKLNKTEAGWEFHSAEGFIEYYNKDKLLTHIEYIDGSIVTVHREYGRVSQVVDEALGKSLTFSYDDKQRLASVTGDSGVAWQYAYDVNGNLKYVYNSDGSMLQYHYEDSQWPHALTGITDTRGIRYATYEYYADGRAKASYHAGNAQRVDITYDDTTGTRTVTNSRGQTTTYTTDVNLGTALVTGISGPGCSTCANGGNTTYDYDPANNNLLSKTENGLTTQYGDYDTKGQYGYKVEAVGTPEERRIEYDYDPRFYNRITEIREPSVYSGAQKVTRYTYDDWGNRLTETVNGYDPDGNPVTRTTRYEYNGPLHQLSLIDGPRTDVGDLTYYRYYPNDPAYGNNRGRLQEVENANGVLIRSNIQYTATGKVESETRLNGLQLGFTYYIGNDRLKTRSETDTFTGQIRTTRWTYLPTGEIETITQAYGTPAATTLTFDYDDARRLVRITDGLGNYIEYTLDTEGNREAERIYDAGGNLRKQLTQAFDIYNQLDTTTQANEAVDYDYAPDGTLDRQIDGRGTVTDYDYDSLRRLTRSVEDDGGSDPTTADAATIYDYDAQDNLTTVTDPIDGTTTYAYDDLGNLTSQTSPDTGTTTFRYDAAGNMIEKTDAKGQIITYSYDALNRLTAIDGPGAESDVSYVYDICSNGQGLLCRVTRGSSVVEYSYTAFGEVAESQGLAYSYDRAGRLAEITYPSGAKVSYEYDPAGNVQTLQMTKDGDSLRLATDIQYTPFGDVSHLVYGNGLTLTQGHDTAYRLRSQNVDATLQMDYSHYDGNGNLQQRNELISGQSSTFGYDALNRLDTAAGSFGQHDYVYDPNGNRTQLTTDAGMTQYGYTPRSNRLTSLDGDSGAIQLDPSGNTTALRGRVLDYTPDNRLKEIEGVAVYSYNGLGQRTRKHRLNENQSIAYLYDQAGQLRVKRTDAGVIQREYVYLNGRPLAVIIADHDGDGVPDSQDNCVYHANPDQYDSNGDGYGNRCDADLNDDGFVNLTDFSLFRQSYGSTDEDADFDGSGFVNLTDFAIFRQFYGISPGPSAVTESVQAQKIYYIHSDHLGTPKALTDEGGTRVWSATHTPFGQATVNEDPDGDGRVVVFNLRFPGQYYDGETGLHYNYFRYYDPETGRYITSDPIGLEGGPNTYLYAQANPLRYSDPLGLLSGKPEIPDWFPPPTFPDTLGECQTQKQEAIVKKCLVISNVTEKIACIDAWRDWELSCIGERACLQDDSKKPS